MPGHRVYQIQIQAIDQQHSRIEQAFHRHFYSATETRKKDDDDEIEILVSHPNVLRYFFCRALQLPPETYGRYTLSPCSITYVAIYPNGVVLCRTVGDAAHLSSTDGKKDRFLW